MLQHSSFSPYENRYKYDFQRCNARHGWAQVDTRQDASYFGQWANPITLELFTYCEGDRTYIKCETQAEFINAFGEMLRWNIEAGYFIGIDGMCNPAIIEAFKRMGFGKYLH